MGMDGTWRQVEPYQSRYRYNGKELVLGLDWYAYGFRHYDAGVGRFMGVDPIADRFAWVTTYNYAENKVPGAVDLHGLQAWVHFTKIANGQAEHQFYYDAQKKNEGGVYREIIDHDHSSGQRGWVSYINYPSMFPKDKDGNFAIPEYREAYSIGGSIEGTLGGGMKLGLGYSEDNFGNWGIHFNVAPTLGLGGGGGLEATQMGNLRKQEGYWLQLQDDIAGNYVSHSINVGPIGIIWRR